MVRTFAFAAASLAVAAIPATAAEPARPTPAQVRNAQETLSLIVSALNDKDMPQETKNGLFDCLYHNSLGKIANGSADVLAHDKKIDRADLTERLRVVAGICGAPKPVPAKGK
jgi:hypothetical protein